MVGRGRRRGRGMRENGVSNFEIKIRERKSDDDPRFWRFNFEGEKKRERDTHFHANDHRNTKLI